MIGKNLLQGGFMDKKTQEILEYLGEVKSEIAALEEHKRRMTEEINSQIKELEFAAYEAAKNTTVQVPARDIIEEIARIAGIPTSWIKVDTITNIAFPSHTKDLSSVFKAVKNQKRPLIIKFIVTNKFDNSNITNFKSSMSLDDKLADGKPLKSQFYVEPNPGAMHNNKRLALTDYSNIICNFNVSDLLHNLDPDQSRNIACQAILNALQASKENTQIQE